MSNGSSEEPRSEATGKRRHFWAKAGLTLGAIAVLGAVGGAWWLWIFLNERLSPLFSKELSDMLDRPVVIGEVERVSLTGVRFGPSAMPPTATDPDELYVDSIDLRINLLQLLRRQLLPQITLTGARAYIEQNAEGAWLDIEFDQEEEDERDEDPFIQTTPTIRLEESEVVLLPFVQQAAANPLPLTIANLNGTVRIEQTDTSDFRNADTLLEAQEITLDLSAEPENSGRVLVNGVIQQPDYEDEDRPEFVNAVDVKLAVQAQEIDLAVLAPVLLPPESALDWVAGIFTGNVDIDLTPGQDPQVTGTARLVDGAIALNALETPFTNIDAQAKFQGNRVAFERFSADFADLSATAKGFIDTRTGYNLTGEIAPLTLVELAAAFNFDLPVETAGVLETVDVRVTGPLREPKITGRVRSADTLTIDQVQLANFASDLTYVIGDRLTFSSLTAEPVDGGTLTGAGTFFFADPAVLSLRLEGQELPADAIGRAYGLPDTIRLGAINLNADISGPINNLTGLVNWDAPGGTYPTRGSAEIASSIVRVRDAVVQVAGGTVSGSGTLAQGQWTANLVAQGIQLGAFNETLAGATSAGTAQLAGSLSDLSLTGIRGTGNFTTALPAGTLNSQIALANGNLNADLVGQGIELGRFNESLAGIVATGNAQVSGSLDNLTPAGIRATGDITASLRGGTLNTQLALANGLWNAAVRTQNFPVAQFTRGLPVNSVSGNANLSGRLDDFSLTAITGNGTLTAAIAGGTLTGDVNLQNGIWQATGRGDNLELQQFSTALQGTGSGTFQLAGNLNNLSPAGIQGRANVVLSDGLATAAGANAALLRMRSPLTADLAWDGRQLQVNSLATAGLFASGTVTPQFSGTGAPTISAIDLALSARDYALNSLPLSLPPLLALEGRATFDGRLTGNAQNLNLTGNLALNDLALNDLRFEPLLTGDVNYSTQQGLDVALLGTQDEIVVNYDAPLRQLDFRVQAGTAIATGDTRGDILTARFYDFPISALNIRPVGAAASYGALRGEITFASAVVNLNNLNTTGQVNIENLGFGYYSVDRLFGGFSYANGVANFYDGRIQIADRNSRGEAMAIRNYDFAGRFSRTGTPQIQATLSTQEGELRDVFEVLKIQELADFRRGFTPAEGFIPRSEEEALALLRTNPAGNPNASLLEQLRRLSEIQERQIQQDLQMEQANLPPLSELQGRFSGEVNLTATLPEDIVLTFDVDGESWRWGPDLSADTVVAQGSYQNGLITLNPLRLSSQFEAETAYIDVEGAFSLDPDDDQDRIMNVTAVNVPIDQLEDIANLPFDLDGRINGTAAVGGQFNNPNLSGQLEIVDGTLNGNPVSQAGATFSYGNARAELDANLLLVGSDDPISLAASIPFTPKFVDVVASDRRYSIQANVQDEGFALLNLFTDQITWVSGEGEAILDLEGDLDANSILPTTFNGFVLLQGATIALRALPEPLTNVTGRIRLAPAARAIIVDSLNGDYTEGQLTAQGLFPIFLPLENLPSSEDTAAPEGTSPEAPTDAPETPPGEAEADFNQPPFAEDFPSPEPPVNAFALTGATPLTVDFTNITLNLKGLYNGQVNGQTVIGGSVIAGPELTGQIRLSDGIVTIPENSNVAQVAPSDDETDPLIPVRFEDLRILLEQDIRIVYGAFLNVEGRGGFRLDGSLADLRPTGTVRLPSGRVGLFAASLRLAGANDRAEFRGNFDPLLDVTLQTALPDVGTGSGIQPTTSPFPRNEVPDNTTIQNIGLTQQGNSLVRINARYRGPASELANITTDSRNLELSSSPLRSDQEIISLLSGNVISALSALDDENALAGIGTFVGSALLGSVREFLGDTVPLSEFRIFQVSETSGAVNESQDLGGEIGFDITSNISVSVLKVLTNDTPFQFNTRYRLSDQFTLRGTTSYEDFTERSGVLLEYETRF